MFHVKHQQGERDAGNTTKERRNKSRVRQKEMAAFDIHDRVNYAVTESKLKIEKDRSMIALNLQIDESICSMYDYFEIFLGRIMLCRKSAEILGTTVKRTFAIRFAICVQADSQWKKSSVKSGQSADNNGLCGKK